ncbi:spermidine synthase [Scopulibacillus darangshiensis]|uniref:Polyamine aminopropyltransferase n=1 Tax=Scopulibacillus darangshiensis TaxID=442528 RepID=A0A4R2PAU1_9BACL|nr:polyamine aminopropyltransferase [Scopulibacillus darangshiensis]TCP32077.1 spermidine synthase [Scopulibacillus darangshiensis]
MSEMSLKQSKRIYWASGIVSICGIIFEVLFGALGSYILGDGVTQYTLTISLFLTGMGIGAFISEKVMKQLISTFIWIEFLVAVIGGFSSFLMFGITAYLSSGTDAFFLYFVIIVIGLLTGLELPLLIRKANEIGVAINKSTARVLFSDYAGGLIGGLLFAFWLRPEFGLVKTAFLVALVNLSVAVWMLFSFRKEIRAFKRMAGFGTIIGLLLFAGVLFGDETAFMFEQKLYRDPIIFEKSTKYQKIIITKEQGDTRLYLDGNLQFSSSDEYRYHEILVHPTVALAGHPTNALILGGGDGMAARELLKYPYIKNIRLVDLDPQMTHLAQTSPELVKLNKKSMTNSRVHITNQDAFEYLKHHSKQYDVILVDLPDPNNESLNKVYTEEFYTQVKQHLTPSGAVMIQATSPTFATKVYWTINKTVEAAGLYTQNLHADIPSFGDWGYVMAARHSFDIDNIKLRKVDMRYLSTSLLHSLDQFGKDEDGVIYEKGKRVKLVPNTLIHPNLIEMYEKAWLYY